MIKKIYLLSFILCISILSGCSRTIFLSRNITDNFSNTDALELAKAVQTENVSRIKKICRKNPEQMYAVDNSNHYTLLHWSVRCLKLKSMKALLECGMDPNIQCPEGGETPLFMACCYGEIPPDFVKILLDYGANPDISLKSVPLDSNGVVNEFYIEGTTPLMMLPSMHIPDKKINMEKARLIVEKGHADINLKNVDGETAAIEALRVKDIEMSRYLIVDLKANVTDDYSFNYDENIPLKTVGLLRRWWIFPLDSEEYKIKMEIVNEFKNQGIDYYAEPVPADVERLIKKKYPDTWEEYIKVY